MSIEPDPKDRMPKFAPGQIMATRNAVDTLPALEILHALNRHVVGDWGDLCEEDWKLNEDALASEGRLLSVYHTKGGVKFYVITEWDRSVTTVLLPEDY
jgi:hypothetical protein